MLTKAAQEPGFSNEVSWHNQEGQQLTLEVVLPISPRVPHWQVFLQRIDEKILLGEYHGHDTLMVFKNVSVIAESEPVENLDDAGKLAKVMEIRLKASQVSTRDDLPVPDFADQPKPSAVYLSRLTANRLPALNPDSATGDAPIVANGATATNGNAAVNANGATGTASTVPDAAANTTAQPPSSPQPQPAEQPPAPTSTAESKPDGNGLQDQDEMISSYLTTRSSARKSKSKAVAPPPEEKPFDPTASYTDITAIDPTGQSRLGNLTEKPLTELLLHLSEEHFTGRVRLEREGQSAVMFLVDGLPVDASHGEARGNMALMELFLWQDGHFKITPSKVGSNRSVTWPLETIMQNKAHLTALVEDLESAGVFNTSTFKQTCPQLTQVQFQTALGDKTSINLDTLKLLYQQMDGRKTLADFESLNLFPKYILLRCLNYLMSRNLICISNKAPTKSKRALKEKKIDAAAVRSVMLSLRNRDTGLLTAPAFLYFLEEEFFRSFRSRNSMSLLLVDLRQIEPTPQGVRINLVSRQTLADAALQIFNCKRQTDGAGHYEAQTIALYLPNTNLSGATTMAKKIQKVLGARPLAGMEGKMLVVMCAIAGIPEDCTNLNNLLASADCALQKANSEGLPIVRYKDLD
jgi:GGDEF domain-containing protein